MAGVFFRIALIYTEHKSVLIFYANKGFSSGYRSENNIFLLCYDAFLFAICPLGLTTTKVRRFTSAKYESSTCKINRKPNILCGSNTGLI